MNKKLILFLIFIGSLGARAQVVTQSADGKGSVILPLNGVSLGFDIGKTEISVGANNYSRALIKKNKKAFRNWFFGGNLSVKNSSGIGNLFQNGNIVPSSNFLGFAGFNINNNEILLKKWENYQEQINEQEKLLKILVEELRLGIIKDIDAAAEVINDQILRDSIKSSIKEEIFKSVDGYALNITINNILSNSNNRPANFISAFKVLFEPRFESYLESRDKIYESKELKALFSKFMNENSVKRLTPFLFGGIDARNFSLYTGLDTSSLSKSLVDTLYQGGQIGIGLNAQVGRWWIGLTYAYVHGDNFSNLTSKEYTLRTINTSQNQTLTSENKTTGYSGKYSMVKRNQLNIDLIKEFSLGDTSRLFTNLYYRGSLFSRDTEYLQNISNLGLGVYFLGKKSKFLGGLYVELPDINNNIEKSKPESERNINPAFKKLTFGVVTKFALSSVLGFQDRPRTPDPK